MQREIARLKAKRLQQTQEDGYESGVPDQPPTTVTQSSAGLSRNVSSELYNGTPLAHEQTDAVNDTYIPKGVPTKLVLSAQSSPVLFLSCCVGWFGAVVMSQTRQ